MEQYQKKPTDETIEEISALFDKQKQQLTATFLSIINMNIVVRKLVIITNGGPELGTINFDDDLEYIDCPPMGIYFWRQWKK